MNNKQSKKFRKQTRKASVEMAAAGYGAVVRKTARQRDWFLVFCILEAIVIIGLAVWVFVK